MKILLWIMKLEKELPHFISFIKFIIIVYIFQKVINMLPRMLSENLCSLNPNVDRLTVSCFFKVNKNGEIISNIQNPPRINQCSKKQKAL